MAEPKQGDPIGTPDLSLEPSPEQFREWLDLAAEHLVNYLRKLEEQPAGDLAAGLELARSLREPLPQQGTAYPELLRFLFEQVIPHSLNTAGPGYLAYIPGGGLLHSALADLIAAATNRYVGVAAAAPGLAQLESNVIHWFCQMVGYPPGASGFLTSGGSLANWAAVVTARRRKLPAHFLSGVCYFSQQAHHSLLKGAVMAGFPQENLRIIPCDQKFRLSVAQLAESIQEDRKKGLRPFLVGASAGTTNTGAVDDLEALAELARREDLWLHVDATYGGFFNLVPEVRPLLAGLSRADSLALDPHKALFLPYGTGSLLVRRGKDLWDTFSLTSDYMPEITRDEELLDFSQISPELSRAFRGLRVWLPLKMHGVEPFRRNLEEKLVLTRWATEQLRSLPHVEIVAEPQLTVVAFRWRPPQLPASRLNELNRQLVEQVNRRRRVHLNTTRLEGRVVLRLCVLSYRTHHRHLETALEDLKAAMASLS